MPSLTLTVTPTNPARGQTVQALYQVLDNEGTPPQTVKVDGKGLIGDTEVIVSTVVTVPGTDPLPVTFEVPTCEGLTFTGTSDPAVFEAVVP